MSLAAFGMSGRFRLSSTSDQARLTYTYAGSERRPDTASAPTRGPKDCDLAQEPAYEAGKQLRLSTEVPLRITVAGWVDGTSLPFPNGGETSWLERLQHALDQGGADTVRQLRGDFVLAHVLPDRSGVRVYKPVNSTIPLFWRQERDAVVWSTDPLSLFRNARPRIDDVDTELLPMIVAEAGFPHHRSWFAGMKRLPTGDCLSVYTRKAAPRLSRFDEFQDESCPPTTVRDAVGELRRRLAEACARILNGTNSAVVLLSGGIDSAVIAYEASRHCRRVVGRHFTLDSFPGFEADRQAAYETAHACGIPVVMHEMSDHAAAGGDYLVGADDGCLRVTHAPTPGVPGAVEYAESIGADVVLTGLLTGEAFTDYSRRELLSTLGWASLNPLESGEPIWQTMSRSFGPPRAGDRRGLLRSLIAGDPTVALPQSYLFFWRSGLTKAAAERVEDGLRDTASRAYRAAGESRGRRLRRWLAQDTYRRLVVRESLNLPHVHATWLNHFFPRRKIFGIPFADRDVVQLILSLPPGHRYAVGHGVRTDKFALRLAYAGNPLPYEIANRRHQAEIDAVPALFVTNNFDLCQKMLGKDSVLYELGVVSESFISSLSPQNAHKAADTIARMCLVEQWLRTMG